MNKSYLPNEQFLTVRWSDLETAWRMLALPSKQCQIEETLQTIQTLEKTMGPEKAIFTMIAATAWLTDDGTGSHDG